MLTFPDAPAGAATRGGWNVKLNPSRSEARIQDLVVEDRDRRRLQVHVGAVALGDGVRRFP